MSYYLPHPATLWRAAHHFDTQAIRRERAKKNGVQPAIFKAARYRSRPVRWVPMLAYQHRIRPW